MMAFQSLTSSLARLSLGPSLRCKALPCASLSRQLSTSMFQVLPTISQLSYRKMTPFIKPALKLNLFQPLSQVHHFSCSPVSLASLAQMHRNGPVIKKRPNKNPLINRPFARGVILKTLIKKPRKPNSANRKCVLVRLTNGMEKTAYVPGIGHNLQEHNIVLVRPGRLQDVPGVKLKCVRGVYDLGHVIKKKM